jgi:hypothetical protein
MASTDENGKVKTENGKRNCELHHNNCIPLPIISGIGTNAYAFGEVIAFAHIAITEYFV